MARQAIKYQTTTIDPGKTVSELQQIIQRYGGTRFEVRWEAGRVVGIRFAVRSEHWGEVPVRLEAPSERIQTIPQKRTSLSHQRRIEQADRIAWRHLKDFVEQALLGVETGLFSLAEAFMARVETTIPKDGSPGEVFTVGELVAARPELAPPIALITDGGAP